MPATNTRIRISAIAAAAVLFALSPGIAANAATSIDGPIDLGTAETFSVLGGSTVTNTDLSVLTGDLGVSPGTSITGFPPGLVGGTTYQTDTTAAQAQADLTTAYGVAASLTPTATGLGDLVDQTLVPGVYSGGELSLTGALELSGSAQSVWVFQAASTLIIGSAADITMSGGASSCNVFWQVGSSATIHTGAQFVGTVMASESVTANTSATIAGRLLASSGAVTLDTNRITVPTGCGPSGTVSSSPTITSSTPPSGEEGTAYSHTITATGSPSPTYDITSGGLPTGLTLDDVSGAITGEPTTAGSYTFTVTVSNGVAPDAVATYTIAVAAAGGAPSLAATGVDASAASLFAAALVAIGVSLVVLTRRKAAHRRHAG